MVEFFRHPVTVFAIYDLITAVATMLQAFWFVHQYKDSYGHDSDSDKYYRVCWAWGIIAGIAAFMSLVLLFVVATRSRIWAIVWSWWELGYVVAYSVLSMIVEQMHWKNKITSMQYFYVFFPRFFGLFGIFVVVIYIFGPWNTGRRSTMSSSYGRHNDDVPVIPSESKTEAGTV